MTRPLDESSPDNWYEIRLQGHLDPRWSTQLDGMKLAERTDGTTVLSGPVIDQAALHGILARLRDIGVPLLAVTRIEPNQVRHPRTPRQSDRRLT